MKRKNNAGFSLVEVLVAIVLLGTLVVPICTSLFLTYRLNDKTDTLLRAQLDVSSAVETLLAEGISEADIQKKISENYGTYQYEYEDPTKSIQFPYYDEGRFPDVYVDVTLIPANFFKDGNGVFLYQNSFECYTVRVTSKLDKSVFVEMQIRESRRSDT